jgi:hypothetical protein
MNFTNEEVKILSNVVDQIAWPTKELELGLSIRKKFDEKLKEIGNEIEKNK